MEPETASIEFDILQTIREAYGLPVERLTFLTDGWATHCYRAEAAGGAAYFVKLYDASLPAPLVAGSRAFYLPLTYQLCTRRLLPQIACPVPAADGRFVTRAGANALIVFHFIEGRAVGFGHLPDDVLVKLAARVGRLHACSRDLDLVDPLVEDFRIAFEETLPADLETLAALEPGDRPGRRGFRDLLLPRRRELRVYLERLKGLQAPLRSGPRDFVLCHTDLHGGNLLLDPAGELYILDWENAMLAPPEQDLFFYAGEDRFWELFWPVYRREFGAARLDVERLAFYYYRRGLEDVAEFLQHALRADHDERDRDALRWVAATLEDLAGVETTVSRIAAHLGDGARPPARG